MTEVDDKSAAVPRMDEDAELDDETLLGASTLAKLEAEKEVVADAVEEVTEPECKSNGETETGKRSS